MTSPLTLRRGLFRHLAGPAIGAGILCLGIAGPATADQMFSPIASEILSGIRDSDASRIPATSGYGAPTIAIRSFAKNVLGSILVRCSESPSYLLSLLLHRLAQPLFLCLNGFALLQTSAFFFASVVS